MLTSLATVIASPAIFTAIYEVTSALLTSVRSVQALNYGGPWRMQQKSLTFLILREGARFYYLLDFSRLVSLFPNYSRDRFNIFWVGFQASTSPGLFLY